MRTTLVMLKEKKKHSLGTIEKDSCLAEVEIQKRSRSYLWGSHKCSSEQWWNGSSWITLQVSNPPEWEKKVGRFNNTTIASYQYGLGPNVLLVTQVIGIRTHLRLWRPINCVWKQLTTPTFCLDHARFCINEAVGKRFHRYYSRGVNPILPLYYPCCERRLTLA